MQAELAVSCPLPSELLMSAPAGLEKEEMAGTLTIQDG